MSGDLVADGVHAIAGRELERDLASMFGRLEETLVNPLAGYQ